MFTIPFSYFKYIENFFCRHLYGGFSLKVFEKYKLVIISAVRLLLTGAHSVGSEHLAPESEWNTVPPGETGGEGGRSAGVLSEPRRN